MKKASTYYKQLRKQVSDMANTANKRLARLERNDLTSSPAFRSWEESGGVRFSVKGKTNEEVASEYWRLKRFLDDTTSTVRGANSVLKEMAENTGIKYNGLADLKAKSKQFFDLASKVKQYLESAEQAGLALQYQKIWESINTYVKQAKIDLSELENVEGLVEKIVEQMTNLENVEKSYEGFSTNGSIWDWIDNK